MQKDSERLLLAWLLSFEKRLAIVEVMFQAHVYVWHKTNASNVRITAVHTLFVKVV